MKSLIAMLALLTLTSTAMANPHRHHGPHGYHGYHGHHHGWRHPVRIIHHRDWVAPLIIGGVVGAAIAHNRAEAQTPPVPQVTVPPVVVPPLAVMPNNCVIVRETLHPDGVIVRDIQCRERQ